ncbi:MAG: ABC transporter substrate-binding protein [Chloroflexi bacterium]|nr:ABC transporter substrate-binding protein [Chloroflexota bacterium]
MCNAANKRRKWLIVNGKWLTCPLATYHLLLAAFHLSLFTLFLLTACASVQPVVKIGLVAPFEGAQREIGYDAIYAARLAVREINMAGGINGTRVALVALDDGGDEQLAAETAVSLTIDPAIVAVIGHGLVETTAVVTPIYAKAGLPFIPLGNPPFSASDPTLLPADFKEAYSNVTPFDETAGPYAAATYDAMQLLFQAMAADIANSARIYRDSVTIGLTGLEYNGLTGTVYQP